MAMVTGNRELAMVDVAGTAWPLFKLEALAAGLIVFLVALAVGASMQVGVLGGASAATLLWLVGSARSIPARDRRPAGMS